MKSATVPLLKSLALLWGAAGVLVLGGCMERHPADPSAVTPSFSTAGEPLSHWGTATVDGNVEATWGGAAVHGPFTAFVPGTDKTARVTFRVMNNADWMYFLVEYDRPVSDPNNVVRLEFRQNGTIDEIWFSSGSPLDRFSADGGSTFRLDTSVPGGTSDVIGVRRNSGGRTVYEFAKRRLAPGAPDLASTPRRDVAFVDFTPVAYTLQLIPGGSAANTTVSGTLEAAVFNDPNKPDLVVTVLGSRCDVTVTARNVDTTEEGDGWLLRRAVQTADGTCRARFIDVPAARYAVTARNTIIKDRTLFQVWPNTGDVDIDLTLPNHQGAVWVENIPATVPQGGTSMPLNPDNYLDAVAAATALGTTEIRNVTLQFTEGRTASCSNAPQGSFVHAMVAFSSTHPRFGLLPPASSNGNAAPPALGTFVGQANQDGSCSLQVPSNEDVVVETVFEGTTYSGLLDASDENVDLNRAPKLTGTWYILDGWGDGDPLDIGMVIFGLERAADGTPTNAFAVQAQVRGFDETGKSTYQFELDMNPTTAPQSIRVTVQCTRGATCVQTDVQPANQAERVLGATGDVDPDGNGYVRLRLDFSGVDLADLRMRTFAPGTGHDFAPNDVPGSNFARWDRSITPENSFKVAF
jgi:hypothetical protein